MTPTKVPTLDQYWERLAAGLLPFSPEEQRAAVTLYLELAKSQPVDTAQLAKPEASQALPRYSSDFDNKVRRQNVKQ